MSATITRPVLRYFGGKWSLADWIISHFPPHRVYTEVFGGAASVLLRKRPAEVEVYNDLHGDLANLFRVLRDNGDALHRALTLTPYARSEHRLAHEPADDPVERARRTVVRSWFSVGTDAINTNGSGFRAYSGTNGSNPSHWPAYVDALPAIIERLRAVLIEEDHAPTVLLRHDHADALHYVDPPYVLDTRSGGGYVHEMSEDDHRTLAAALHDARGAVVLSGYDCPLYGDLFGGWVRVERDTLADHAGKRTEILWLNPAAARALPQRSLFDSSPLPSPSPLAPEPR